MLCVVRVMSSAFDVSCVHLMVLQVASHREAQRERLIEGEGVIIICPRGLLNHCFDGNGDMFHGLLMSWCTYKGTFRYQMILFWGLQTTE